MDETNELLEYIYQDCEMATTTLTELLKQLQGKDNKIKRTVEDILKEYEKYLKESIKLLKAHKIKPKKLGMMAKMGAKAGIKTNVKNDNSDSKISDVVIQGLVMGIIDISKRIDDFEKEANKDIVKLANRLLEFQESSVEKLKEYL
ncbi:MAG: hypothetical protein J6A52_00220 [Bacilli bacterium]|nr:hypothetical protein [Bacilli bacterium]